MYLQTQYSHQNFSVRVHPVLSPLPSPEVWNPLIPIQQNWGKSSRGIIWLYLRPRNYFCLASTIALIVEQQGRFSKWSFTSNRWNPRPTDQATEKPEVTGEQIVDELA